MRFIYFRAKEKRRFVGPNSGFQSQLKLYHTMGWRIDPTNPQYKLFRLHCAAYHVSKGVELISFKITVSTETYEFPVLLFLTTLQQGYFQLHLWI